MSAHHAVTLCLLGVTFTGCQEPGSRGLSPSVSHNQTPEWTTQTFRSSTVTVESRSLDSDAIERTQKQLSAITLVPIEKAEQIKAEFGFAVYRQEGPDTSPSRFFIVPQLFVQSGLFGGRAEIEDHTDGRATLRFRVAVVNGLSKHIASEMSFVELPEQYIIQDPVKLAQELSKDFESKPQLLPFQSCPKNMRLRFGSESLQVKTLLPEGFCPQHQLFEVAVTESKKKIQNLLEEDLNGKNVQLEAEFQPSPSFIRAVTSFDLNGLHLKEALYKRFTDLALPGKAIGESLIDLLNSFLAQVGYKPEPDTILLPLIDQIIATHFESLFCNTSGGLCLRLRTEPHVGDTNISFDITETGTILPSSPPISVHAQLTGVTYDLSHFIISAEQTDDSNPPAEGRSGGLLRPVRDGDLVEMEIVAINAAKRQYPAPILDSLASKLDNPVCVAWGEAPRREELDPSSCLQWNLECAEHRTTCIREEEYCVEGERECIERGVGLCFFCCAHVEFVCHQTGRRCAQTSSACAIWQRGSCKQYGTKQVPAGPSPCVRTENQWTKLWRLSEVPSIVRTALPPGDLDRETLFKGLWVQLSSWQAQATGNFEKATTSCPLSTFFPTIEQQGTHLKVRFRLQNNKEAGCEPFSSQNRQEGREPELTLVNHLTRPETYPCGFREESWNGRIHYSCAALGKTSDQPIFDTYYPRYDIEGTLRIPGARFTSISQKELSK